MSKKPILIVKAGGTYPDMAARYGDFEDWFIARMDRSAGTIETVSPFSGEPLPPVASFGGIIITGSHDMVTDKKPWSEKTADWVKAAVEAEIPLLGVCYGHQLLAHAMGGVVGDNPNGKEFGTVSIRLNPDGRKDRLFDGTPETVCRPGLSQPECAAVASRRDPAGIVGVGSPPRVYRRKAGLGCSVSP